MFEFAIVLFAIAALGGATMAVLHFRGQSPPKLALAAVHGVFAAAGLVVLLVAMLQVGTGGAQGIALGLFVVAALGGFALLSFHLRGKPLPGALIVGHGLLAVAGFGILLWTVLALRA